MRTSNIILEYAGIILGFIMIICLLFILIITAFSKPNKINPKTDKVIFAIMKYSIAIYALLFVFISIYNCIT